MASMSGSPSGSDFRTSAWASSSSDGFDILVSPSPSTRVLHNGCKNTSKCVVQVSRPHTFLLPVPHRRVSSTSTAKAAFGRNGQWNWAHSPRKPDMPDVPELHEAGDDSVDPLGSVRLRCIHDGPVVLWRGADGPPSLHSGGIP
jgi:hypothetical protein